MAVSWADGNDLALVSRPSAYTDGSALVFNIVKKALSPIVINRLGLEAAWNSATSSPVSGLIFFTSQSQRGGRLQLVNLQGDVLQNISFLTLPTKCAFGTTVQASSPSIAGSTSTVTSTIVAVASTTTPLTSAAGLFCAIPRDQDTLSYYDLPDAYEQHQIFTSDDLYGVNVMNGHIETIFNDQTQSFDMSNVSVTGSSLFFVNRYDQKLYAIKIQ